MPKQEKIIKKDSFFKRTLLSLIFLILFGVMMYLLQQIFMEGKNMTEIKNDLQNEVIDLVGDVKKQIPLTDSAIDQYGQHLAKWGSSHCRSIKINDKPINLEGPNAGGCSRVEYKKYWQGSDNYKDDADYAAKWGQSSLNQLIQLRSNLRESIISGSCSSKKIHDFLISDFKQMSEEELLKNINCLGDINFYATAFGYE